MIILGIDPGVARVGYGILQYEGEKICAQMHGCIETAKELSQAERLLLIRNAISELCVQHQPSVIAVEKLFFEKVAHHFEIDLEDLQ